MKPETLSPRDEQRMLGCVKRAADLVDQKGLSPDEAIEKVAREDQLGPGAIGMVARAYNTGRQLGQWRANQSILDKLASFPLADPDKILAAVYPDKVDTPAEAATKTAFDADYLLPPSWLPDETALELARRDLPGLTKVAADKTAAEPTLTKLHATWDRSRLTHEETRRQAQRQDDQLRSKVAAVTDYFRQAPGYRLPFAAVEQVAVAYQGPAAADLLKLAYQRARLREPVSSGLTVQKQAADLAAEPYSLIEDCIKAAGDLLEARQRAEAARTAFEKAGRDLRPFAGTGGACRPPPRRPSSGRTRSEKAGSGLTSEVGAIAAGDILGGAYLHHAGMGEGSRPPPEPDYASELGPERMAALRAIHTLAERAKSKGKGHEGHDKKAAFGPMVAGAIGSGLTRGMGGVPKTKDDLIEDQWLSLEDPAHQHELRKIKVQAMLNSMLTDPDDPISGHDPDKVLQVYNEIAQATPRVSQHSAVLKPLLRKRLAGHTEPFEAKELVDLEKGLRDTHSPTPSTNSLIKAPDSVLG